MQKINCRERFFLDKREASIYVLFVKVGDEIDASQESVS